MTLGDRLKDAVGRLRGIPPVLDVYVFGKHPAWPDFIDVARLPPVPPSFRHFHDHLRPGVDAVYTSPAALPRLLLWTARGRSGILAIRPSRDGGNPRTGQFRRSPLLLGIRGTLPLHAMLSFGSDRLASLTEKLSDPDLSADDVIAAVTDETAAWRTAFTSVPAPPAPPDRPQPHQLLPLAPDHVDLQKRAADAVSHFVTDRSPTVLAVAAAPAGLFVARADWDRLTAEELAGSMKDPTSV